MNLSLYKVADEYLQVCEALLDQKDELPAEVIANTIEALAGDVEKKSINVAAYYKNLQKEVAAMKDYEKEMRDRRRRLENHTERLREYLKSNMQRCGMQKIKGTEFTISIRKSPDSVVIDDAYSLPQDYIDHIDIHPDKNKIKQAIQAGEKIPGAHLETGSSLIIR